MMSPLIANIFFAFFHIFCSMKVDASEYIVHPSGVLDAFENQPYRMHYEHEDFDEEDDYDEYYDEYYDGYYDEYYDEYFYESDEHYDEADYLFSIKTSHEFERIRRDDGFDWRFNGTTRDIWFKLGCSEIFERERPIHSQSTWEHARTLYKSLTSQNNTIASDIKINGFSVQFEVKQSPGKGRGIYAAQDIAEGTLVYQSKQTARFNDGLTYRKFLLGLEPDIACDVLQWAYVQNLYDSEDDWISVDLDEGCFLNDGQWEDEDNLGCNEDYEDEIPADCKTSFFALRDISAGEELLCNYSDFAEEDGWYNFGLTDD